MERIAAGLVSLLIVATPAFAADLSPEDAGQHVGETATVCGTVASAHYSPQSRGKPTFLDMGHAYPDEVFTAVIWGDDRSKFGDPESLAGQRVCVTGPIRQYRGRPEVVLRESVPARKVGALRRPSSPPQPPFTRRRWRITRLGERQLGPSQGQTEGRE